MKKEMKEEEKEENLLKELCGDDVKLYGLLSSCLYFNPVAAISKTDLETLTEEAEKCIKDENYGMAMQKYRMAVDKAIFEATQNLGEKERYVKIIQDLASKTAKVAEKAKEKGEKEGFVSPSFEGSIMHYEFMSERSEDVIKIASLFYSERLEDQGAIERREAREERREEAERGWAKEDREIRERREARLLVIDRMGGKERVEAEKDEIRIAEKEKEGEKERREARRKERVRAERDESTIAEKEKERREARRKEAENQE